MRRDDALLAGANLAVAAFLVVAGPSMAIATADPGGSHGHGGNSGSGRSGSGQSSSSRATSGNGNHGNSGFGSRGNSGGNASVGAQGSSGNSPKSKATGSGNGNSNGNGSSNASSSSNGNTNDTATSVASGQSNSGSNIGSNSPAAVPPVTPVRRPVPVVVAERHTGTAPAVRRWAPAPGVATPPAVEVHDPAIPSEAGTADLLTADDTQIPVWAAAEPVAIRGDLFGLAGLVLMPLVGLAVGYRQAKAARDADLTIGR